MGRKRKDFSDKFKLEVAKEALKKRAKEAEKRHTESSRTSCGTSSSRSRIR